MSVFHSFKPPKSLSPACKAVLPEAVMASASIYSYQDVTYWGLNGYWTPSESGSMPSISVGYEIGDPELVLVHSAPL